VKLRSAGLLPYRIDPAGTLEVVIVHPGGPFWAKRDVGAWSIAKGECGLDEDPRIAAAREFAEELGQPAPSGAWIELGEVRQKSGKRVVAWAVDAPRLEVENLRSNLVEIVWPPRSGHRMSVPEVDQARWCRSDEARRLLLGAQVAFVDRLLAALGPPAGDVAGSPGSVV
jgi:predicted NUDIX family NTP pyrophosphohydrolase